MSKKNKNNTKSKLIPELRFPEFKDAPQWEVKELGEVFSFLTTNSLSRACLNYETGSIKNIHYGDIHTKFRSLFNINIEEVPYINDDITINNPNFCQVGDIIFADASEDLIDVGKTIEITDTNNELLVSGLHTIMARPSKGTFSKGFAAFLFQSNRIKQAIKFTAQGTKVYGITANSIKSIPLPLPSLAEQERIGEFFYVLDSLIQAQSKEVQLLRLRKKGLMQKLFPYEGETTPEWRFPEFKDAPEWEVKTIGEVMSYANGLAHEQFVCPDGRYTIVNSKFISSDGKVSKFTNNPRRLAKKDDILMVLSDVPAGKALAKCLLINKDNTYTVNQRICILSSKVHNSTFLYYSLNRNRYFLRFDDKKKQTNLRKVEIVSCPLPLPSLAEQERIGALFSTLDSLIEAKSQRLEQLKKHKKGLMQKMFP